MLRELQQELQNGISPLISGIVADTQSLLQKEIELARAELRVEVSKIRQSFLLIGIGYALALVSGILFAATIAALLIYLRPETLLWQSFCAVAVLVGITSWISFAYSRALRRDIRIVPEQTLESIKENAEWIAKQVQ